MPGTWKLKGKVLVACNCDWGCPCNFNARPTTGKCEGIIFKQGDLGATTHFRVTKKVEFDHSAKYMAVGPFEYAGP